MKSNYDGFRGWLNYIRDYKENKINDDVTEARLINSNNKIEKLEKHIEELKRIGKEKDELILLRDKRIETTNKKYSNCVKRNDELRNTLNSQYKEIEELKQKVEIKELSRRQCAGAIGGLKAKINELKKELEKANYTINFYKTHQKSPNIEELKAYEYSRKEVEKRIKDAKK